MKFKFYPSFVIASTSSFKTCILFFETPDYMYRYIWFEEKERKS